MVLTLRNVSLGELDFNPMNYYLEDYPESCLPKKFNSRTGRAKKNLFEKLDTSIYEESARIVTFHTSEERLGLWIKALHVFYYEN